MTALNLLLAGGVGAVIGAAFYVIDYVVGDDVPTFWFGLLHDWTTGIGIVAVVGVIIAWAADVAGAWDIIAVLLGLFGAEIGAYLTALFFAIVESIASIVPDFLKPQVP